MKHTNHHTWTPEQLLGLSPDHFTIRSGQGNAVDQKWLSVGTQNAIVWGEYDNKNRPPFQVTLLMEHMYFSCSCLSRKFPCQHVVGLLMLHGQTAVSFPTTTPPNWVRHAQSQFAQLWHQQQQRSPQLISDEALAELKSGLTELDRWLYDLVQNGFSTLAEKQKAYYETIANRMWDVQAVTLTEQLQSLTKINKADPDWIKQFLTRLGPLALLSHSFKQFEQLPLPAQADLIAATGRPFLLYTNGAEPIHDQWLVLGHFSDTVSNQQFLHTWLWGVTHQRIAQIDHTLQGKHPAGVCYITGSVLDAALIFGVSNWPLRAQFVTKPHSQPAPATSIGNRSIRHAIEAFADAKTKTPWLRQFPLVLKAVTPLLENGRWLIADEGGYSLPLPNGFNYGWHLKALASHTGITLFGQWDGDELIPISAKVDEQQWVDLHTLRGIK